MAGPVLPNLEEFDVKDEQVRKLMKIKREKNEVPAVVPPVFPPLVPSMCASMNLLLPFLPPLPPLVSRKVTVCA